MPVTAAVARAASPDGTVDVVVAAQRSARRRRRRRAARSTASPAARSAVHGPVSRPLVASVPSALSADQPTAVCPSSAPRQVVAEVGRHVAGERHRAVAAAVDRRPAHLELRDRSASSRGACVDAGRVDLRARRTRRSAQRQRAADVVVGERRPSASGGRGPLRSPAGAGQRGVEPRIGERDRRDRLPPAGRRRRRAACRRRSRSRPRRRTACL